MRPSAQPLWSSPAFVAGAILVYLAAHFAARLAMAPTLGIDDAEQTLFAQHFVWGYRFRQPPLFTWMLLPAFSVFGVNIVAVSVLRYLLLGLGYGFMYLTARRVIADPACAALAVFSYALIYVFAYYAHHDLTHTTALATAIAATFYVFTRLADRPSLGHYLLFGLCIGVGTLTKWNFLMLAVGLPLTCLVLPRYRRLVLTWKALPAMAMAGLAVLPGALWMLTHVDSFGGLGDRHHRGQHRPALRRRDGRRQRRTGPGGAGFPVAAAAAVPGGAGPARLARPGGGVASPRRPASAPISWAR